MMGGPDPENRGAVNWEEPDRYPERRALITRLNRLRKEKRALTAGLFELVTVSDERVLGFKRRTADVAEQLIVLINPTPHPIETRFTSKTVGYGRDPDFGPRHGGGLSELYGALCHNLGAVSVSTARTAGALSLRAVYPL